MERRAEKSLLLLLMLSSCLLVFPLASSVPMPRSLRLGSQQLTPSQETTTLGAAINDLGRTEARMVREVTFDYPTPGPNHDHDPGHGGRV